MAAEQSDSVARFTDRVDDYARYRPGYPAEIIAWLAADFDLSPSWIVADVGAGTGLSSELFLKNGNPVHAIEPNQAMRATAQRLLGHHPGFRLIDGTAEQTTLPDKSVDLVVAGQAFHWFKVAEARREFRRILRPGGLAMIAWNTHRSQATPFMRAYEAMLYEYGIDYSKVHHKNVGEATLRAFFGGPYQSRTFFNEQVLDLEGFKGRVLSSSYVPSVDHPRRGPMLTALERIFAEHARQGVVHVEYDTEVYVGAIS